MEEAIRKLEEYQATMVFRYDDESQAKEVVQDVINYLKEGMENGIHEVDNGLGSTSEA